MIPHGLDQDRLSKLRPFLQQGEKILWAGAPNPKAIFSRSDAFMVPFSILWLSFIVFWFVGAFTAPRDSDSPEGTIFPFFAVPFLVIGVYMLIGRFFVKGWVNRRTVYAITDSNLVILTHSLFGPSVKMTDISGLREVQQDLKGNGRGSVIFGPPMDRNGRNGWDMFGVNSSRGLGFYDIPDARRVYDMVIRQRDEVRRVSLAQ